MSFFKKKKEKKVACCFLIQVSLEDLDSCSVVKHLLILKVVVAVKNNTLAI